MGIESWALLGAAFLGLVHVSVSSFAFKAQVGNAYTVGARDENLARTGLAARLDRAQGNFLETFAVFAAVVLLLEVNDLTGGWLSVVGSLVYLGGRIAYLPLYAAGLPWIRTLCWNAATAGLFMVMLAVIVRT